MKILTWNINGIRARKIPLSKLFETLDADVICLQETKVTSDQLDEKSAIVDGYNSYFSFSKGKSGYSGVATFVSDTAVPIKSEEGLSGTIASSCREENIGCYGNLSLFSNEELSSLDNEGRAILTQHKMMTHDGENTLLTVINVYCPRADPEREDRKTFKLRFYELLQIRAEAIAAAGSHVIVLGDINTSHKPIDSCDPDEDFLSRPSRLWMNHFLSDVEKSNKETCMDVNTPPHGGQFIDTFRYLHPTQKEAYTCWSTVTGARATNYGTRIDYILADIKLTTNALSDCIIMPEIEGSDHCPVIATFQWELISAKKCPSLCTKYLPQFAGKQQKLIGYLQKKSLVPVGTNLHKNISSDGTDLTDVNILKRQCSDTEEVSKKLKTEMPRIVQKQSSLMTYLMRSQPKIISDQSSSDQPTGLLHQAVKQVSLTKPDDLKVDGEGKDCIQGGSRRETNLSVASWKSLLKGPTPPPYCKGHGEPCVLRTVKKDSLNKGRQFYVCNRPDGAKNNPMARCDHFQWVEKKK